jgi:hypothetical protein
MFGGINTVILRQGEDTDFMSHGWSPFFMKVKNDNARYFA